MSVYLEINKEQQRGVYEIVVKEGRINWRSYLMPENWYYCHLIGFMYFFHVYFYICTRAYNSTIRIGTGGITEVFTGSFLKAVEGEKVKITYGKTSEDVYVDVTKGKLFTDL